MLASQHETRPDTALGSATSTSGVMLTNPRREDVNRVLSLRVHVGSVLRTVDELMNDFTFHSHHQGSCIFDGEHGVKPKIDDLHHYYLLNFVHGVAAMIEPLGTEKRIRCRLSRSPLRRACL